MPVASVAYRDHEATARAVDRHIRELRPPVRHLALRPHDYRASSFPEWWLVPGTDRTPWRHGRLCFRRLSATPRTMVAGFYLERGYGRQLAEMLAPEALLDSGWFWYRFLNDALGGAFDAPLRTSLERTGGPLLVHLDLYHFNDRSVAGQVQPDDRLTFALRDAELVLHPVEPPDDELTFLNYPMQLKDLALQIESLEGVSWYWIDLLIGVHLRYDTPEAPEVWDAAALWHNALAPWLPWAH